MSRSLKWIIARTGVILLALSMCSLALAVPPRGKQAAKAKRPEVKPKLPVMEATRVPMAGVNPDKRAAAITSAKTIDRLIAADLAKHNIAPNPLASDEQFVRRAYLRISGTIPQAPQAESYCRGTTADRRYVLIDRLLGSPAHASHMYNAWADTLRLIDSAQGNNYLGPYQEWVKDSLRQNLPYDQFVEAMLTAEGHVWDNPAAGYLLRDRGMPLDNLNNTIRIFLGTQIGCAQCHNHPFDRWTQKEFYELAAFSAGNDYRHDMNKELGKLLAREAPKNMAAGGWFYEQVDYNSPEGRLAQQLQRANNHSLGENPKAQLKFPKDYGYDNAKPGDVAKPAVIFGKMPDLSGKSRRQAFADWITSDDNPRFARTIANRLWKRMFGRGLIEPLDDMKDDTVAANPELMTFLEEEIKRLDYDMREFVRILCYTDLFQRQVTYDDLDPDQVYHFPGPVLQRMSAEQVWDSLLTLSVENPEYKFDFSEQFAKSVNLQNARSVNDILQQVQAFKDYQSHVNAERKKVQYKGQELLPASELRQPLPDGHFLRQFGQSNREQIDDSFTDGSVPQLLAMFNGAVTHMMLEPGSVIYKRVVAKKNVHEQIDVMFWSLLSRQPTKEEQALAAAEIHDHGAAGYGNVIWALLNTREFLFIQ